MSDTVDTGGEPAVKLFGDPRSKFIERGPDRRAAPTTVSRDLVRATGEPTGRQMDPVRAVRAGRGDGVATALAVLGVLLFGASMIVGTLILYNAKDVGAFSNPWNSTRVAIGIAVFAIGIVQSALLIGLSRAISYLLASVRLQTREAGVAHLPGAASSVALPSNRATDPQQS